MEIALAILGGLGIGAILNTLVDRYLQYGLDKKKILYDKKFEAYSEFGKFGLGFGLAEGKPGHIFKALADTAKVELLIDTEELEGKIRSFIIALDKLNDEDKDPPTSEEKKEYYRLQDESVEIMKLLKKDLKNTLN